jgi:hypothetical protein
MDIPVIIVNYNRLTSVISMVETLRSWEVEKIIILDNESSYPPLLDWYKTVDFPVHPVMENLGHLAPWFSGFVDRYDTRYYAVTDPDLDLSAIPKDGIGRLIRGLELRPDVQKCGFGIEIDDLPDGFPLKKEVQDWEAPFWQKPWGDGYYEAPVDTTFAVYEKGRPTDHSLMNIPCLRTDSPYLVRHLPWYLTPETVTDEDRFYFHSCATYCHWSGAIMTRLGI